MVARHLDFIKQKIGSKDEARAYYHTIQAENRAPQRIDYQPPAPELPTVKQALEAFLADFEGRGSKSALPGYRSNARLLTDLWGTLRVDQVTPTLVREFVAAQREAEFAPATINRRLALLKGTWKLLLEERPDLPNPMARVKLLRENNQREAFLTPAQEAKLQATLPDWAFRLLQIAILTGVRKGNLLELEKTSIDWERKHLALPAIKGNRRHFVPLSEEAISILRRQCDSHSHGLVWASSAGTPIHPGNFHQRVWKPALEQAGVELRFHDLRHSAASRMADEGVGLYVIGKVLGHQHPKTTQRYAHLTEAAVREAVQRIQIVPELSLEQDKPSSGAVD